MRSEARPAPALPAVRTCLTKADTASSRTRYNRPDLVLPPGSGENAPNVPRRQEGCSREYRSKASHEQSPRASRCRAPGLHRPCGISSELKAARTWSLAQIANALDVRVTTLFREAAAFSRMALLVRGRSTTGVSAVFPDCPKIASSNLVSQDGPKCFQSLLKVDPLFA